MPTELQNAWIKDFFGVDPATYDVVTPLAMAGAGSAPRSVPTAMPAAAPAANGNVHAHELKKDPGPPIDTDTSIPHLFAKTMDQKKFDNLGKVAKTAMWLQPGLKNSIESFAEKQKAATASGAPFPETPAEPEPLPTVGSDNPFAEETSLPPEPIANTGDAVAAAAKVPAAGRFAALGAALTDASRDAAEHHFTRDDVNNMTFDSAKGWATGKAVYDLGKKMTPTGQAIVDGVAARLGKNPATPDVPSADTAGGPDAAVEVAAPTLVPAEHHVAETATPVAGETAAETHPVPTAVTGHAPPVAEQAGDESVLAKGSAVSEVAAQGAKAEARGMWNAAAGAVSKGLGGIVGRTLAGGAISGGIAAATALFTDGPKVRDGKAKAGDATADVVVTTAKTGLFAVAGGVVASTAETATATVVTDGLVAGATTLGFATGGAEIGGALGSVIPGAGTMAGAVVGLAGGALVGAGLEALDQHFGGSAAAMKAIGGFLDDHVEKPLEAVWKGGQSVVDATGKVLSPLTTAINEGEHELWTKAAEVAKATPELADAAKKHAEQMIADTRKKFEQFEAAAAKHAKELCDAGARAVGAGKEFVGQKIQEFSGDVSRGIDAGEQALRDAPEQIHHEAHELKEGAKHVVHEAEQRFEEGVEKAHHKAHELKEGAKHVVHEAEERLQEGVEKVHHKAHQLKEGAEHLAHEFGDHVHEGVEHAQHAVHQLTEEAQKRIHHAHQQLQHIGEQIHKAAHRFKNGAQHEIEAAKHELHQLYQQAHDVGHNIKQAAGHKLHEMEHAVVRKAEEWKEAAKHALGSFFGF
jgi:ElaB/YqjD/DUF883 family membrane-anchored ribosome-binding protein